MVNTKTATSTTLRTKYPQAFQRCLPEALNYGKCIAQSIEVKAKECDKEFVNFNSPDLNALNLGLNEAPERPKQALFNSAQLVSKFIMDNIEVQMHQQFLSLNEKRDKIKSNYETIEVLKNRLDAKKSRERVGMTRATYVKMIFDVTKKFDKQNKELGQAVAETRLLQRDINNLNGRLERSFTVVRDAILKNSQNDAWNSECYRLLNKMNEDFDRIIGCIQEIGELKREVRQLEDQLGQMR